MGGQCAKDAAVPARNNTLVTSLYLSARSVMARAPFQEVVDGVWVVTPYFRPTQNERTFSTPFLLINARRQGCAYLPTSRTIPDPRNILGKSLEALISSEGQDTAVRIAALDAAVASARRRVSAMQGVECESLRISGSVRHKAEARSTLVARECARLVPPGSTAGLIGYSGQIEHELSTLFSIQSFDLDPQIIGYNTPSGFTVRHGDEIYGCDQLSGLVATAMTLVTETLDQLLDLAAAKGIPLIIYAQTGANLGPLLVTAGVDTVIAEHIPFYNFEGSSTITVSRRRD